MTRGGRAGGVSPPGCGWCSTLGGVAAAAMEERGDEPAAEAEAALASS